MTLITRTLDGVGAIQEDSDPTNFYAAGDGRVIYVKPESGTDTGTFYNTVHPTESDNITWRSVKCKLARRADAATDDYRVVTRLIGVLWDGTQELIYEDVDTTITTSTVDRMIIFDLTGSGSTPQLSQVSRNGATSGKVYLQLPLRYGNYERVELRPPWLSDHVYCRVIPILGSGLGAKSCAEFPLYITLNKTASMQNDFADIRFTSPDGKTQLCHDITHKEDGVRATFAVYMDIVAGSPEITPLLMFNGKTGMDDRCSPFNVYSIYDDFEDGKWEGSRWPYWPWYTYNGGSGGMETGAPISGSRSLKHTGGDNSFTLINRSFEYTPYLWDGLRVDYDFKLTSNGTNEYSPLIVHWTHFIDTDNRLQLYSFYNSPTNQTILRLQYVVAGSTISNDNVVLWAGKYPLNSVKHFTITDHNSKFKLYIDNELKIDKAYTLNFQPIKFGFGVTYTGVGVYDNIKIGSMPLSYPTPQASTTAWGNVAVQPDGTPSPETQTLTFTKPWITQPTPIYVYAQEKGLEGMKTNNTIIYDKSILRMGPDGVDKYAALKLQPLVEADQNCNITFSDFTYEYEVL